MDFTHRPIKTMVYVERSGTETPHALKGWVDKAVAYAASLPAK
jgi:hypothetical protein